MTKPKHAWMVRAGNENELADWVEGKNAVAIGWSNMGDLSNLKSREDFKQRYRTVNPDDSPGSTGINAGQVYRFTREMREGDYVLTYLKASREILIGLVGGPYEFNTDHFPNHLSEHYPHVRQVQWLKRVSRDDFSAPARASLGRPPTVFELDDHLDEIHHLATMMEEHLVVVEEKTSEEPPFYQEVKARADELIADLVSRLDPYAFQDLVAALLQAMGFRAVSAPPGRDHGVDIVAHPDPLGFERPHIKAQVKHRRSSVSGPEMREFLGTLHAGDSGLYVSTGDFTSDAKQAAQHSAVPVTLLNRDDFIRLLLEHYEAIAPEYKAHVPLRKVWVPVE